MNENLIEAQYNVTKRSKLKKFYDENKIFLYSIIIALIVIIVSYGFYTENKKKKNKFFAESYITAKTYLQNDNNIKATEDLKKIVFSDNTTYSTLALFLILDKKLIEDKEELLSLFNYVLENNKYDEEIKNLIIYKKALFQSDHVDENELLNILKPLISSDTLWKPHALLLLGDFFAYKGEYLKAEEFYLKILSLKGLSKDFYDQAKSQLILIKK